MLIIVDLSNKLINFNLFENFFYTLKREGKLAITNTCHLTSNNKIDYNE